MVNIVHKNTNPFLSIIVPIRNEEQHIAQCIQSILSQEYESDNYEILIVDGMSDDRTREIVKEYQKQHRNIKLLDNPDKVTTPALNIGIKAAKGDIIARLDGHAYFGEGYLRNCVNYLKNNHIDCVGGKLISINETFVGKAIAGAMSSSFGVGNVKFRTSGKGGLVDTLAFGVYRREVFEKIGNFDERMNFCEDDEFNYRLRKLGGKIFLNPEERCYYYPRSNLKKLFRQYFKYGSAKIMVFKKHFNMMQSRQFVPPLFVFSLMCSFLLGLFFKSFMWIFIVIIFLYLSVNIIFSIRVSLKSGIKYFSILPIIFATLHISYGVGFCWGLVKFSKGWLKKVIGLRS